MTRIVPPGSRSPRQAPRETPFWLFPCLRKLRRCPQVSTVILVVFLLLFLGSTIGQNHIRTAGVVGSNQQLPSSLDIRVNEVTLSFVITDRHHRWVGDLSENELRLRDDGYPPESIQVFQKEAEVPLRVGLLVDVSDSIRQRFAFEKNAAAAFIGQIVDSTKDLAFVLGFNNQPLLAQDLTPDPQALSAAVRDLHLGGATAIYDALYFACNKLEQHSEKGFSRRILVLLTDGDDNMSSIHPEQVIGYALRTDVTIFALHTDPSPETSDPNYRTLERLTRDTGGQILQAYNQKQMTKAFEELSSQLRNSYFVAYRPAHFTRDGHFRKIQLKTTRRGTHIVCRRGYYASDDKRR